MAQSTPNLAAIMRQIHDEELAQSMPQRKLITTDVVRQRYIELAHSGSPTSKSAAYAMGCTCMWWDSGSIIEFDPACPILVLHRGAFSMPEANPKAGHAVADGKAPLDYLEPICDAGEARVLFGGAAKYGRRNFRDPSTEMLWSTYIGSMRRHLNALHAGEDLDPESGEHHLSHIRANTAVLMAAMDAGTLRDDRLDTTVASRSSAVHKNGNQDAKADTWSATTVEPFVVDAQCCVTGLCPSNGCELRHGGLCHDMKVA